MEKPTIEELCREVNRLLHYGYHASTTRVEMIGLYIADIQRKLQEELNAPRNN